jgi:hypothetical protein
MAEEVETVEAGMWDSFIKFNERLTLIILKIKSQMDISEDDYELIKPLFGCIWGGQIIFRVPKVSVAVETAVEQGLFADNPAKDMTKATEEVSEVVGGIVIDEGALNQ